MAAAAMRPIIHPLRQHAQPELRDRLCGLADVWCVMRADDATTSSGAPRRCSAPARVATTSSPWLTHSQCPSSRDCRYERSMDLNMQEAVARASSRISTARAMRYIRTVPLDVLAGYHFSRFFGAYWHLVIFGPRPQRAHLFSRAARDLSSARIRAAILCVRRRQHLRVLPLAAAAAAASAIASTRGGHACSARRRSTAPFDTGPRRSVVHVVPNLATPAMRRDRRGATAYGDASTCSWRDLWREHVYACGEQ